MIPAPIDPARIRRAGFADPGPHLIPAGFDPEFQDQYPAERVALLPGRESAAILAVAAVEYRRLLRDSGRSGALESWQYLAEDCQRLADRARALLPITITPDPEPYPDAAAMLADIRRGRFVVSRANSEHPIWSESDNVAFRIAHDLYGHATSGGDFGWRGELLACSAHAPMLDPRSLPALACECIAQTGYAIASGKFADRQVCGITPAIERIPYKLGWL